MTFDEYQKAAMKTDSFNKTERDLMSDGFVNKVLGVCGETGEFADKIKKLRRNKGHSQLDDTEVDELSRELGDVLWYLATLADYLGLSFDDVAEQNIAKLADRAKRNKINSQGDNR
ncbi:MAG: nucleoside triphosphate pyrophosphohydrolase family protein [Candidatus Saccharimonadales bacterium]|nr:nucleoside triphosphate pyrophosphohydrolase family protein [Candidatus Saccharimonadales bacterium]